MEKLIDCFLPSMTKILATTIIGLLMTSLFLSSSGWALEGGSARNQVPTSTPVKHLVVIFDENVSFDHYFGTYPYATNPAGEPRFVARPGTPSVNGLTGALLTNNPNLANPQRLDRSQALTCDQDHA